MTPHATTIHAADLFGGIPNSTNPAFDDICKFCDDNSAEVNAALPWLAAELGHYDGYPAMLHFVRAWSGKRLYVSENYARFVGRVGFSVTEATHRRCLLNLSESSQIEVPSAWGVFLALRRAAIMLAVRSGLPAVEIARRYGATMRSLR